MGVRVACHFSFLCCAFCFCLWEVGRVGVRVACFLFVGGSVLPDILVFCVVCFAFLCGGVCVAYHFSFLCCVFCFVCGGSCFLPF